MNSRASEGAKEQMCQMHTQDTELAPSKKLWSLELRLYGLRNSISRDTASRLWLLPRTEHLIFLE